MDRRITHLKGLSPTWGPPTPCKQAISPGLSANYLKPFSFFRKIFSHDMRDNPAKAGGSRDIGSKENTKKYFEKENSCLETPLNLKFPFLMQTDPRSQLIYKFMLTIKGALLMFGKESVGSSNSSSLASACA